MGFMFYPRGGSAQVIRSLARALPMQAWDVTVVSGSVHLPGHLGDARAFFDGLDVRPVDYSAAFACVDPLCADPPLHPSFEDRADAPDRVFAKVDDATYAHLVAAWSRVLREAGATQADILHLHHLTPLNAAARQVAPEVPVVGHLHGTELLMLEAIAHGPPATWLHAAAWAERMRRWAAACHRLVVPSAALIPRAHELLGVAPERCVHVPNGFDPQRFDRRRVDRLELWRRLLVERPQGWRPGGAPGSVAYPASSLGVLSEGPVLLAVGRFTALKRLDLLLRAYICARPAFRVPASLILLGGFPGEWEGEHPYEAIERLGAQNVFLAGWHGQEALAEVFAAADVVVHAASQEPFGQVLVEGMACGLPTVAVAAQGPGELIIDGETGWLAPPDDVEGLAAALVAAVNDAAERRRRGLAAHAAMHARYAWPALGAQLACTYAAVQRSSSAHRRPISTGRRERASRVRLTESVS